MSLIPEGKVAVLVSEGYGAGWSTWGKRESCLDQELALAFLDGSSKETICAIAKKNWPDQYDGGLLGCEVHFLDKGTRFRIDEYDGAEGLVVYSDDEYLTA